MDSIARERRDNAPRPRAITPSPPCAKCGLWMGWDLRLMIDGHGLQLSSLCRSGQEMVERSDEWRAAMIEKGWSQPRSGRPHASAGDSLRNGSIGRIWLAGF